MQEEPLEGIHIKLTILFRGGHMSRFTVIPISDNQEMFNLTIDKFKKDIWTDYLTNK